MTYCTSSPSSATTSASSTASRGIRLCQECCRFDFDHYLTHKLEEHICLGSWKDLLRRQRCPFCRLVVYSLRSDPASTPYYPATRIFLNNKLSWELGVELSPYELNKSESYSNKFDLRSCAKYLKQSGIPDAYRYVVETEEQTGTSDRYIQYLAHREVSPERRQFFGRKLDPQSVDIGMIASWLRDCRQHHAESCEDAGAAGFVLPKRLRLIDVHERCTVRVSTDSKPRYVCLSYVWGVEQMYRETRKRPHVLKRDDIGFSHGEQRAKLPERLPRTIEDSVLLTRKLGFRYLWNDALCIVQDDPTDLKGLHLEVMDAIYGCAAITIAAATGAHADCGLPGIGDIRRIPQKSELVKGLRFATMSPPFSVVEGSMELPWNKRGWTLQEKLVSKRILLFTKSQVYFKCSEAIWTEEVCMETGRLSKSVESRRAKFRWGPDRLSYIPGVSAYLARTWNPSLNADDEITDAKGMPDYAAIVQNFSARRLSVPEDAEFAVTGLLAVIGDVIGDFVFGLPKDHLLSALLWYPVPGSRYAQNSIANLPSWTWLTRPLTEKWITYELLDDQSLRRLVNYLGHNLKKAGEWDGLKWSDSDKLVISNVINTFQEPLGLRGHTVDRVCVNESAGAQVIDAASPMAFLSKGSIGQAMLCFNKESVLHTIAPMLDKWLHEVCTKRQVAPKRLWSPSARSLSVHTPSLIFETSVVRFGVGKPLHKPNDPNVDENGIFELLDNDSNCCGEVHTTYSTVKALSNRQATFLSICWGLSLLEASPAESHLPRWMTSVIYWKASLDSEDHFAGQKLDKGFIGMLDSFAGRHGYNMSENWKTGARVRFNKDTMGQLYDVFKNARDGKPLPRFLWPVVNVIMVDGDGSTAKRTGVGRVMMSAWKAVRTRPQEVVFI